MRDICVQIAEIINNHVEKLELNESQYEENLAELGMDSIGFIQIIVEIEERFQVEIPDEYLLLSEMNTVCKMASVVMSLTKNVEK